VAIAVDSSGGAYVTGSTGSTDFPQAGFNPPIPFGGTEDAFVTKLNVNGSAVDYSTTIGGSGFDVGWGIAVDGPGNAFGIGYTNSPNFPVRNAFQPNLGGMDDAFVLQIGLGCNWRAGRCEAPCSTDCAEILFQSCRDLGCPNPRVLPLNPDGSCNVQCQ